MQFLISKTRALKALTHGVRTVGRDGSLTNVLLHAESSGTVIWTTTNVVMVTQITTPATVQETGTVLVPARLLLKVIKELSSDITFVYKETQLVLSSDTATFHLNVLPVEDPIQQVVHEVINGVAHMIEAEILYQMCTMVSFALSNNINAAPQVTSMLFEGKDGMLRTVATNGHQLAMAMHAHAYEGALFVPRASVLEIEHLLKHVCTPMQIVLSEIVFRMEYASDDMRIVFSTSLVRDGRRIPYENVLPTESHGTMILEKNALLASIRRLSCVSTERENGIILHCVPKDHACILENHGRRKGCGKEELELVCHEGTTVPFDIMVQLPYLQSMIQHVSGDEVRMTYLYPTSPLVIRGTADNWLGLIMPMRLQ